jgi:uncharacterized protein (TIGR00661 family)
MRILYGVASEGLSHATRSKVVLEFMRSRGHKLRVVASGRAFEFLKLHFDDVVEIPSLTLRYADNTLDRDISIIRNAIVSPGILYRRAKTHFKKAAKFTPELCMSDTDSFSYLFAKKHELPVILIDHQQVIERCVHNEAIEQVSLLGWPATKAFVRARFPACNQYIVPTFYFPKVKKKYVETTTLVPSILRTSILNIKPSRGNHILVYQTNVSESALIESLNRLHHLKFIVYGLRRDATYGNTILKEFSDEGFVRDLASARAVITNGRLSLIDEAIFLEKPVLSVPMRHSPEEEINSQYVRELGFGHSARVVTPESVEAFINQEEACLVRVRAAKRDGNEILFRRLERKLKEFAP